MTAPRVRVAGVGEVGASALDCPAIVVHIGVEERAKPVLLWVGAVPALPPIDRAGVDQLRTPRRVPHVLLADQVHVHGSTGGSRLWYQQNATDTDRQSRKGCGDPLSDGHNSPKGRVLKIFQQY